ncbi:hypothetical protein L1049_020765 [Liquidambar formosana]|uniref:Uncharacterized protein n=1 Tax=Liquidambar formosana TaxID=63359 RepID=A0AAP0S8H3_LIQFO
MMYRVFYDVFHVENGLVGAVEDELDGEVADVINEVGVEDEVDGGMEESSESGSDSEDSVRSERILFGDPDEDVLTDSEPIANEDVETLIDVAISRRVGGGGASVSGVSEVDGGVGEVDGEDDSVLGVPWVKAGEGVPWVKAGEKVAGVKLVEMKEVKVVQQAGLD